MTGTLLLVGALQQRVQKVVRLGLPAGRGNLLHIPALHGTDDDSCLHLALYVRTYRIKWHITSESLCNQSQADSGYASKDDRRNVAWCLTKQALMLDTIDPPQRS